MQVVEAKPKNSRTKSRDAKIGFIEDLDRDGCIARWRAMFGASPPKYTSIEFMRRALTYEAQVKAYGGHSKTVQKVFRAASKLEQSHRTEDGCKNAVLPNTSEKDDVAVKTNADGQHLPSNGDVQNAVDAEALSRDVKPLISTATRKEKNKPSVLSIRAGTHLVREWNGRTYQVEALDKGFRLDGKTYRSLSAIAKKITGAHWSGPRFFGLES